MLIDVSITGIPSTTRLILWAMSAGRCEYEGCNVSLFIDPLTKSVFNQAYIAHIIADSPDGPRGHQTLSFDLRKDLGNLMTLCDRHHRLIDTEAVAEHTVERLREMKRRHEERIQLLAEIGDEKRSNVLLYGANIGRHDSPLTLSCARQGMVPFRFPAEAGCIELGLKNSSVQDHDEEFWATELRHLDTCFVAKVTQMREQRIIKNYSVFALAPQPLLVRLGTLLGDIFPAEVFQLKKEPVTWAWIDPDEEEPLEFVIHEPTNVTKNVALKVSLSARISDERVLTAFPGNCSIWELTVEHPNNDLIRTRSQLKTFRRTVRTLLDRIKHTHGEHARLNVFPAMPVSTAVEFGRVWNPKAQLPLTIFDQNRKVGGFVKALEIGNE